MWIIFLWKTHTCELQSAETLLYGTQLFGTLTHVGHNHVEDLFSFEYLTPAGQNVTCDTKYRIFCCTL